MSIYFVKTILSGVMFLSAFVNVFLMFEAFGREERRYDVHKLKKWHRMNGLLFVLIYFFVTYFCLNSIVQGKLELSPRAAFHSVFAMAVFLLLALKISFLEIYKQFSGKVLTIGPVMALIAFGMIGTSGGYYLLVTRLHTDTTFDEIREYKDRGMQQEAAAESMNLRTDADSIGRGKKLFVARCAFCHNAYDDKAGIGPSLKGVLKNKTLPVSRRPATPVNIRHQLREPFARMPSFDRLSEDDVADLLAFLNTL